MNVNRQYLAVAALALIGISLITIGATGIAAPQADVPDQSGAWTMFSDGEPVSCWIVTPYESTIAENLTLYHWERVNCTG